MSQRINIILGLIVVVLIAIGVIVRYAPPSSNEDGTIDNASDRPSEQVFPQFDSSNFDPTSSATINNTWWPLKPGTRWVFEGSSLEDGERVDHMVVETVTDLTKEIGGVRAAVNMEEDYSDGQLVEREIAFHAQDQNGNVWHLGQLRETYDEEEFVGSQVWWVGEPTSSKAGIRMWTDPKMGDVAAQGYAPSPFNWTDSGRVYQMGQKTKVAAGSYDNVIVVEEWDQETPPGVFQLKYYARDVGLVRIGFRGPDPEEEELELVKVEQLRPSMLEEVRNEALKVEERAYMYSKTQPASVIQ